MSKLWKRSISMLLALVMVLGYITPVTVRAEDAPPSSADEVTEDHSLVNADGFIWLTKVEEGPYAPASEKLIAMIGSGKLDDMIREAIGDTSGADVLYEGKDQVLNVGNYLDLMYKQDAVTAMQEDIKASIQNHELVTFMVGGVPKKIAFRNVLTASVDFGVDLVIQNTAAGAPEDWQNQVANILEQASVTVKHGADVIPAAWAKVADVSKESYNVSWPDVAREPVDTVAAKIVVTIYAVDYDEEKNLAGCKEIVGEVILRENRRLFDVTYTDGVDTQVVFADEVLTVIEGSATPALADPVREYYNFTGWTPAVAATVTQDAVYTATWAPVMDNNSNGIADQEEVFTITYTDGVGGKVFRDAVFYANGDALTPEYIAERKYYSFVEWNPGVSEKVTGNATYEAIWAPILDVAPNGQPDGIADEEQVFKVTYTDGVGGKAFVDRVHELAWGKEIPAYTPVREYYIFKGWDKEVAASVTDNVTYTATWEPELDEDENGVADQEQTYTVTYKYYVGTEEFVESYNVAWGDFTTLFTPSRTYYTFGGWSPEVQGYVYSNATYTGTLIPVMDNDGNGIADQEQDFTIKYYLSEDDATPYATFTAKGNAVTPTPVNPERENSHFGGWLDENGKSVSAKVTGNVKYVAQWSAHFTVNYVVVFADTGATMSFTLPVNDEGIAPIPAEIGEEEGYIWSGWCVEGGALFDFTTKLTAPVTLTCTYTMKIVDENENEIADGTAEDPYVVYEFYHKNGFVMETKKFLGKEYAFDGTNYGYDYTQHQYPSTPTDGQLFIRWDVTEVTDPTDGAYTISYQCKPVIVTDKNNNDKEDGTTEDPYVNYIFLNADNSQYDKVEKIGLDNGFDYQTVEYPAPAGKLFLHWVEKEEVSADQCTYTYTYTPVLAPDADHDGKADGTTADPYYIHIFKMQDGTVLYQSEKQPTSDVLAVVYPTPDGMTFLEWVLSAYANGSDADYSFTFTCTYTPNVIVDRNGNRLEDGTEEDPFVYYIFRMEDTNADPLLYVEWLAGDDAVVATNVTYPDDKFVRWEENTYTGADGYVYHEYTPLFDRNGNGAIDAEEVDSVGVALEDSLVEYAAGEMRVTLNKGGVSYTGVVYVDGLLSNGQFTYNAAKPITATPLWNADKTEMMAYVSAIRVIKNSDPTDVTDLQLNRDAEFNAVYAPAVMLLGETEPGYRLEVEYTLAALELKPEADRTLELTTEKRTFNSEDIYKASVAAPAYDDEKEIKVAYKARTATTSEVNLNTLYSQLDANLVSEIKKALKDRGFTNANGNMDVSWGDAWCDVDTTVSYVSAQQIANSICQKVLDESKNDAGELDIGMLITNALDLPTDLKNAIESQAELRPFHYVPGNTKEITKFVNISYRDEKMTTEAENVKVKLVQTAEFTSVSGPGQINVTYGSFDANSLTSQFTVIKTDGNQPVSGLKVILEDPDCVNWSVGTYHDVKVVFEGNSEYAESSATFTLVIGKATASIKFEPITVEKGNPYDPAPEVTPAGAGIVHVIAGVDVNELDQDLFAGISKDKNVGDVTVKTWIKLNDDFYNSILKEIGVYSGFHTVDEVKESVSDYAEIHDMLTATLDPIMVALDDAENMIQTNLGITTNIVLSITFDLDSKPTESGFYLNYAQMMDTTNFNEATAYSTLIITPLTVSPNEGGVQLVYKNMTDAQNVFELENDGTKKDLKVTHNGAYVDAEVFYYGLTTRAESTMEVPSAPGIYVASTIVTEVDGATGEERKVGSDAAIIVVKQSAASLEIKGETLIYDGNRHVLDVIARDDNGNKLSGVGVTVISGTVNEDSDDGNISLEDLKANVNIDFPAKLDSLWVKFCNSEAGQSLGLNPDSKTTTANNVVAFLNWCKQQAKAYTEAAVNNLKALGVPELPANDYVSSEQIENGIDRVAGSIEYFMGQMLRALDKLIEQVDRIPENLSVSIKDASELNYKDTGIYLFAGVITDPDYEPAVASGVLMIKTDGVYKMYETHRPYTGKGQDIAVDDETSRDDLVMVVDQNDPSQAKITFHLDSDMTKVLETALKKAGFTLNNGSNAVVGTIYTKGEAKFEDLSEALIAEFRKNAIDKVTAKLEAIKPELGEAYESALSDAIASVEANLPDVTDKISARLQDLDRLSNTTLIIVNGELPKEIGKYDFYGFDYDVAETGNTLTIHPVTVQVMADEMTKIYGANDPEKYTATVTYLSYNGVGPIADLEMESVALPVGMSEADVVTYQISRAAGEAVGDYAYTAVSTLVGDEAIFQLNEVEQTNKFHIVPMTITVTAVVDPSEIKEGETAAVTVKVEDADGEAVNGVTTDWFIEGVAGKDISALTEGTYTIVPVVEDTNYAVTIINATLTVNKVVPTGVIEHVGSTLSLVGEIYINNYVKISGFEGIDISENSGLLIWKTKPEEAAALYGTEDIIKEHLIYVPSNGRYAQQTDGFSPKKFADEIWFRAYVKTGEDSYVYGPLKEFSVQDYCESIIKNHTTSDLKNVCIALLHYGTAAQKYFDYNEDDYSNKSILADYPAEAFNSALLTPVTVATTNIPVSDKITHVGKTLSLDSATKVNYYDKFEGESVIQERLFWIDVTGELTLDNVTEVRQMQYVQTNGRWAVQSAIFAGRELEKTIYSCVHFVDTEGNDHYGEVIAFSPEAYANTIINTSSNQELIEAVKRMTIYGEYAKIYFANK